MQRTARSNRIRPGHPTNYHANYGWASASLGYLPLATAGAGLEYLGSDDGRAQFRTPLATLHKFDGFADAFLDNRGRTGLQDLFFDLAPKLPWKLQGKAIYHAFWSAENGTFLGQEFDFVTTRKFGEHWTVLAKGTFYWASTFAARGVTAGPDGPAIAPRPSRWRFTLEATFDF